MKWAYSAVFILSTKAQNVKWGKPHLCVESVQNRAFLKQRKALKTIIRFFNYRLIIVLW